MPSIAILILVIASSAIVANGRTVHTPDQLMMPLLFPSVGTDGGNMLPSPNGPTRLIHVIEQIIKYVSSIKSTEQFIDNLVHRQRDTAEKTKVLTFLNKCFEITHKVIQDEIAYVLGMPTTRKKSSSPPSPFTLDELQQAQGKINDLLMGIEKRLAALKTWIPPTMPFLGFF